MLRPLTDTVTNLRSWSSTSFKLLDSSNAEELPFQHHTPSLRKSHSAKQSSNRTPHTLFRSLGCTSFGRASPLSNLVICRCSSVDSTWRHSKDCNTTPTKLLDPGGHVPVRSWSVSNVPDIAVFELSNSWVNSQNPESLRLDHFWTLASIMLDQFHLRPKQVAASRLIRAG